MFVHKGVLDPAGNPGPCGGRTTGVNRCAIVPPHRPDASSMDALDRVSDPQHPRTRVPRGSNELSGSGSSGKSRSA